MATGTPAEVLTEDLVAAVYGVRCRITVDDAGPYVRFEHGGSPRSQLQEY